MANVDPSSFHVYRLGGLIGDDKIVKAEDRTTNLYYLKNSRSANQWQFALHAEGPDGPLICRVTSPYVGPLTLGSAPDPIVISMTADRRLVRMERRRGAFDGTHWFKGPDDNEYRWHPRSHLWRDEMRCLSAHGDVVATYRVTTMAVSKDGELRINPSGRFMDNLLVATCLAMRTPSH
ncbi:hypothetical protein F5I97DRAFT_1923456 [Phlebopus sp. FC_14]|nr:hypothetical protein F5I97DRAFT_1923456 [Phlebopus sp. FC_14]